MLKPCLVCGELASGTRCAAHCLPHPPKTKSNKALGYDHRWRRLSERARRVQPFCSDCGTPDDLTTDHSPEAWQRRLPIRLQDVYVVGRKRGRARPPAPARPGGDGVNGEGSTRSSVSGQLDPGWMGSRPRGRAPGGQAESGSQSGSAERLLLECDGVPLPIVIGLLGRRNGEARGRNVHLNLAPGVDGDHVVVRVGDDDDRFSASFHPRSMP